MTHERAIRDLEDILNQWIGHRILITKEENGDLDQTVIDLERYDREDYENGRDDYLPKAAFQLIGQGQTVGDNRYPALPYSSFDIPLDDISEIHSDPEGVFFRTDRAVYTLTPI